MEVEIIKVGGSLFEFPGLLLKLKTFLDSLGACTKVIVTGGGKAVRNLEFTNPVPNSTQEHWACVQIMTKNAVWLNESLPTAILTDSVYPPSLGIHILDSFSFCKADIDSNKQFNLPENRRVRSDSIALRYAIASGARKLWLLKSCPMAKEMDWGQATDLGLVDAHFSQLIQQKPKRLTMGWVDFLNWQPS